MGHGGRAGPRRGRRRPPNVDRPAGVEAIGRSTVRRNGRDPGLDPGANGETRRCDPKLVSHQAVDSGFNGGGMGHGGGVRVYEPEKSTVDNEYWICQTQTYARPGENLARRSWSFRRTLMENIPTPLR